MTSGNCVVPGKRPRRDDSGQVLVLAAVMLPVLIGVVGLAIDVGHAFDYRKQMQMAADSGAVAGAFAVKADPLIGSSDLAAVVDIDTAQNGFVNGGGITVTVCRPGVDVGCTTTYTYTATSRAVKVTLSQGKATFFTKVLGFASMTIGATAVASLGASSNGCAYMLSHTASKAFQTSGSGTINAPNCAIFDNSNRVSDAFFVGSGWTVNAGSIHVVGGTSIAGTVTPAPTTGITAVEDPFAYLTPPTVPVACDYTNFVASGTMTISPGKYCGDLKVSGNGSVVTMDAGTYIIEGGGLIVKDTATLNGTAGVTFYITGSTAKPSSFTNGTHINLSAPSSGPLEGILFYAPIVNNSTSNVLDSDDQNMNGVIYFPGQHIEWKGNSSGGCQILVADTIKFTGNSSLDSTCAGLANGSPIGKKIALAE